MIYCVEDDAGIRELVVYTLRNTGFEADGFEDGAALTAALKKCKPQLILLDIMLPGEDGITILMISHDVGAAVKAASHVLHIGETTFFGTKAQYLHHIAQEGGDNTHV